MRIGILGAGQLGRMLALAGYPLGMEFRFFDRNPDSPAGHLAELVCADFGDTRELDRFAAGLDAVTYEFENVPVLSARHLARALPVWPPPLALQVSQDRLMEKRCFSDHGVPVAPFEAVSSRAELAGAAKRIGLPAVLKTRRMGYDGKGQMVIRAASAFDAAWEAVRGAPCVLEGFVRFRRELSILAVRGRDGATVFYPLTENAHEAGILRVSRAPARDLSPKLQGEAERHAAAILKTLGYVGVLAIEFFEVGDGLVANEMAPRVHNSGHWSIEGAECSQFENHLRAVAGLPLGSPTARGHSAMVNLIGAMPPMEKLAAVPGLHVHSYAKAPRKGRKVGHVTLCAEDEDGREARLSELSEALR